jgi:hypothetical protein
VDVLTDPLFHLHFSKKNPEPKTTS